VEGTGGGKEENISGKGKVKSPERPKKGVEFYTGTTPLQNGSLSLDSPKPQNLKIAERGSN